MTTAAIEQPPYYAASRIALEEARYGGMLHPATKRRRPRRYATVIEAREDGNGNVVAIAFRCPFCGGVHWSSYAFWQPDTATAWCGAPASLVTLKWAGEIEQPPAPTQLEVQAARQTDDDQHAELDELTQPAGGTPA